jgi:hypothetical protein
MAIDQTVPEDSLLKGFRFHAFQLNSNIVVIETEARYAEAGLAAIIGLPVALPIVWDLTNSASEKSLIGLVIADGSFTAYATYFLIMGTFAMLPFMCAVWFWGGRNCLSSGRFGRT